MRDGLKVWDTDTHLRPTLETLEPYYDPDLRARLPELEKYKRAISEESRATEGRVAGNHQYVFPGNVEFRRTLGQAGPDSTKSHSQRKKFLGTKQPSAGAEDNNADARIHDMDEEGVDVQLMVPGMPKPTLLNDASLEVGFLRAYNRFASDFCGKYPHRLKALLPVLEDAVEESVAEIKRYAACPWMVGVWPLVKNDTPLDHPRMEPIWAAIDDAGLVVVHHSHANSPPYYPGYQDLWDNAMLGRAASHPWGAMRAVGAFIGAGLLERYPSLRFGILECGCGWLPFWGRRLDDQAEYVGGAAPMTQKISDQMAGGRFFASLEMAEGADMIQMVTDFLGPQLLMYASDYPHPECRFPNSVDYFLGWKSLGDDLRRKLLWENPVRFYGEP